VLFKQSSCYIFIADLKSYALSIRVYNEATKLFDIKHYRILKNYSTKVYITEKKLFDSILDLVEYYRGKIYDFGVYFSAVFQF